MSRPVGALDVIAEAMAPLRGRIVLDVGCGAGRLARPLAEAGAGWIGVDPEPPRETVAPVVRAGAEASPFADGAVGGVVFLNALHHVPLASLDAALAEAARVAAPGAPVVVIEPRVEGALSEVIAVIDDESEVRRAAQAALDRAVADGRLIELRAFDYDRTESWPDFDAFLAAIVAVEPHRAEAAAARCGALRDAFERLSRPGGRGRALEQPMRARILQAPARRPSGGEGREAR